MTTVKRNENGRDGKGRFIKGNKGGGRTKMPAAFKNFLVEKSFEALQRVADIVMAPDATPRDVIAGTRLLLEYAIGKPGGEYDRERLDLEKRKLDLVEGKDGPKVIQIIVDPDAEDWGD